MIEPPADAPPPSPPVVPEPPPPPDPPAAPPPVAEIVLTGEKTERELQLEKDLDSERNSRKKVELDNTQLQEQVHRLKSPPPPDAPPKPRRKKRTPLGVQVGRGRD
jgi:hypothetical protein